MVKANAYGLGVAPVAKALEAAGCHTFFVATLEEAITLRGILPDARIAVFQGVMSGEALAFVNHRLVPVLNSPEQLRRWQQVSTQSDGRIAILHVDTGMARLGFTPEAFAALSDADMQQAQVHLLMSHLACSSDPAHPQNHAQLELFISLCERFPELPTSLPNSGGIFLGEAWHDDLARPGCALYGIYPGEGDAVPIHPVVRLSAPIIQLRQLQHDQAVGYGATQTLKAGSRLATVAIGYADGVFRHVSHKLCGYLAGKKCPLVGRVTMDLLTFDVSMLPENEVYEGARIELMNQQQTVNELATIADTIGYEVLTSLGERIARHYTNWTQS